MEVEMNIVGITEDNKLVLESNGMIFKLDGCEIDIDKLCQTYEEKTGEELELQVFKDDNFIDEEM
ncbi:hypothetical protein C1H57_08410 [Clostridium sp. 2-1]|uniref:hypothetical protein n=1 Tax=Clostridium TaxID=1485 RepID=UPI000CDB2F68|nr:MULTISPECIES: hypothetical protein [Clostridium]MBN7575429.1 hypothetical protein [Clostridium beijerinckii]MBN7580740.1 hypothetical protein [Clostridium beijerinckii]MBN7585193.1 hypothetical protein [Clostridium beijerinckii]MBO0522001.1 hypothetical protein [Clostridium beijerinckii]POO91831.1 hypothetical protein C1H57_08410 [Clostridium sp. 2-1]